MLSPEDALYGAAYNVLFERVMPDSCTTRQLLAELSGKLNDIAVWAESQPTDVAAAYARAIPDMLKRATDRVENNERATQMHEARRTIPTPP